MQMRRWDVPALGLILGVVACATSRLPLEGRRVGPECAAARERARATPTPSGLTAARPAKIFVPPLPPPANIRGHTALIEVTVDSTGEIPRDGVLVSGIADRAYASELRRQTIRTPVVAATLDGCIVAGRFTMTFKF
jgi:hypothetical protein